MSEVSREERLTSVLVGMSGILVDGFDVIELLQLLVEDCVALLDCDAGALMLADSSGRLRAVVSTGAEATRMAEMQLAVGAGPSVECFTLRESVTAAGVEALYERWPGFAEAAEGTGFRAVHVTPLRLRGQVLGTIELLSTGAEPSTHRDITTARALADIATIGIPQGQATRRTHTVTAGLQHALDSRVLIEQAKGVLSEAQSITLDEAFTLLRNYARYNGATLRSVAESVVTRTTGPIRRSVQVAGRAGSTVGAPEGAQ